MSREDLAGVASLAVAVAGRAGEAGAGASRALQLLRGMAEGATELGREEPCAPPGESSDVVLVCGATVTVLPVPTLAHRPSPALPHATPHASIPLPLVPPQACRPSGSPWPSPPIPVSPTIPMKTWQW